MTGSTEFDQVVASLLVASQRTEDDQATESIDRALERIIQQGDRDRLPAPSDTPIEVGEQAPDFELPGVSKDGVEMLQLSEFTDTGPVVLTFYPFDFSPVCTSQLCTFRDVEWLTIREEIDVLGISVDSVYSHEVFREQHELLFPLLTDRLATVAGQFGVRYEEWENHPAVCQRALFALDETRTVRYRWIATDADEEPSIDNLEESIAWVE